MDSVYRYMSTGEHNTLHLSSTVWTLSKWLKGCPLYDYSTSISVCGVWGARAGVKSPGGNITHKYT